MTTTTIRTLPDRDLTGTRCRPSPAEVVAVGITAVALVGFGAYGFATGAPSTVGYLASIVVVAGLIGWVRKAPLPGALAIGLSLEAIVNLAGGLVATNHDGLYNATIGPGSARLQTHLLQYDHPAHAFAFFLGALTLWTLLTPPAPTASERRHLIALSVVAGLGIGAVNETIEFLATLAHTGAHVGGYANTGWDLVSNSVGVLAAWLVMVVARPGAQPSVS